MPARHLYDWLHNNYDRLIQWNDRLKRELPGLMLMLPDSSAGSLLDLGCGTGGHMETLLARGFQAYGVDMSEQLIEVATRKLERWNPPLAVADIVDGVPAKWGKFASQLCLGNTLSHIAPDRIEQFATNAIARAKRGGKLIIENRNWDRLLLSRDRFLKPVESNGEIFMRLLDYPTKKNSPVVMTVALWSNNRWDSQSVQLWPYPSDHLIKIFEAAGWKLESLSGSVSGTEFNPAESSDWVTVWRK